MFKLFSFRPPKTLPRADKDQIKLIMGLGNPGEKYQNTYHNVGRLYLDKLSSEPFKKYKHFEFSKGNQFILVRSTTYMNESGMAVKQALNYFKLKPENLLLVHDDSDINMGEYKITFSQNSAGHNGVQSIINHLKTKNFFRLKIGIRTNQNKKAGQFVLSKISKKDSDILEGVFSDITI